MHRGVTGRYETTTVGGERVNAFVPRPLPPVPPLDLRAFQVDLEAALVALGRLDGLSAFLPDPHFFIYGYVRKEAVLSSQIEGTQSSLSDLLRFESSQTPGVLNADVVDVANYVGAMEHGLARLAQGRPLCNRLLLEIHARLSSGRGSGEMPGVSPLAKLDRRYAPGERALRAAASAVGFRLHGGVGRVPERRPDTVRAADPCSRGACPCPV